MGIPRLEERLRAMAFRARLEKELIPELEPEMIMLREAMRELECSERLVETIKVSLCVFGKVGRADVGLADRVGVWESVE